MTSRPALPHGIGPHEGRELDLMLSGEKPLAMFCDIVPSAYTWPDARFEPHVSSGRLVQKEMLTETPDGRYTVRHLYYALPHEAWRIDEAHALALMHFETWCDEAADVCAQLGRLLGYREDDIRRFIAWVEQTQRDRCGPSLGHTSGP
jgi:hypothetical protein